jgi:hypothetical protein
MFVALKGAKKFWETTALGGGVKAVDVVAGTAFFGVSGGLIGAVAFAPPNFLEIFLLGWLFSGDFWCLSFACYGAWSSANCICATLGTEKCLPGQSLAIVSSVFSAALTVAVHSAHSPNAAGV